jgi:hypothetical protein
MPGRKGRSAAAALALGFLASPAMAWFERPPPEAACAAFDLHLLRQVEAAGEWRTVEPERLLSVVEAMAGARRLCREGRIAEASRLYEALALDPALVGLLR